MTFQNNQPSTLSKVFDFLWNLFPVYKQELKKFIPMGLMMLFILFNYTVLRNAKDALVTTGNGSSAAVIPYLKTYGTLPAAMLFVVFYTAISNRLSREKIFYLCITVFLGFFALFGFVIYPNTHLFHPDIEKITQLQDSLPYLKWFVAMWGNWSYCLFFIFAELWGSTILSLFFWKYANDITASKEAKRFYPLFGFIGNIGLISAGHVGEAISGSSSTMETSMYILMTLVVISGIITIGLYSYVNRIVAKEQVEAEAAAPTEKKPKKSKPKLGLKESFEYIFTSPHIMCIAILVLSYGITINFIDVIWKDQVRILVNGDRNAFLGYMANFSKITGYIALPLMLIAGSVLRRMTWKNAALIVPIILASTSLLFYSIVIYGNMFGATAPMLTAYGLSFTAVQLAAGIGKWQGALTKASKYSLFDSTKEMAYIPLDQELKSKGKAAVDVTGGRLGKSGGSFTISTLTSIFPSASTPSLAPYLAGASALVFAVWFAAIVSLQKKLNLCSQDEENTQTAETGTIKPAAAPAS